MNKWKLAKLLEVISCVLAGLGIWAYGSDLVLSCWLLGLASVVGVYGIVVFFSRQNDLTAKLRRAWNERQK